MLTPVRGRPARSELRRDAIDTAMMVALGVAASGRPPRATKGDANDNTRRAAALVAKLFADIGATRGFSVKTILTVWYDRASYRRPRYPTEAVDSGNPFRNDVRILRGVDPTVGPGDVLAWYSQRIRAGKPPLAHPFDRVREYASEGIVSR